MDLNFQNQNSCRPSWSGVFQFGIFLSVTLNESMCVSASGLSSSPCYSFFMLFIHLVFLFFLFQYLTLEIYEYSFLCFHFIWAFFICTFFTNLLVGFSFIILEGPVLLVLLDCVVVSFFILPSFANTFSFISSSCIVSLICCCLFFQAFHSIVSLCIFPTCSRCFFICPSCYISHPAFVILFGFLRGIPILSLTSFAST